jgi:hypothetical protein
MSIDMIYIYNLKQIDTCNSYLCETKIINYE